MFAGRLRRGFRTGLAVFGEFFLGESSVVAAVREGAALA